MLVGCCRQTNFRPPKTSLISHRNRARVCEQCRRRIKHQGPELKAVDVFNDPSGRAFLEAVEALLPDHRERMYPPTVALSIFIKQVPYAAKAFGYPYQAGYWQNEFNVVNYVENPYRMFIGLPARTTYGGFQYLLLLGNERNPCTLSLLICSYLRLICRNATAVIVPIKHGYTKRKN
jgi:hypothetical protein